jgi:thiamine monophosphate kinase
MDNTDGVSQTFSELSELNGLQFIIDYDKLPIHELSCKVADALSTNVFDLVLSAGADFQLLGTISGKIAQNEVEKYFNNNIHIVGNTLKGEGLWVRDLKKKVKKAHVAGWNYYTAIE